MVTTFLIGIALSRGPDAAARHQAYLELLGAGMLGSVNYEYSLTPQWSARTWMAIIPGGHAGGVFPGAMAQYSLGEKYLQMFTGLGAAFAFEVDGRAYAVGSIGLRYFVTGPDSGFFTQFVTYGFFGLGEGGGLLPWPGLSFGYSF